jgi:hypothetical protein
MSVNQVSGRDGMSFKDAYWLMWFDIGCEEMFD